MPDEKGTVREADETRPDRHCIADVIGAGIINVYDDREGLFFYDGHRRSLARPRHICREGLGTSQERTPGGEHETEENTYSIREKTKAHDLKGQISG